MGSAVIRLVDAVVRCVACGQPPGCACWVRLKCKGCGRTLMVPREVGDGAVDEIETHCPECAE